MATSCRIVRNATWRKSPRCSPFCADCFAANATIFSRSHVFSVPRTLSSRVRRKLIWCITKQQPVANRRRSGDVAIAAIGFGRLQLRVMMSFARSLRAPKRTRHTVTRPSSPAARTMRRAGWGRTTVKSVTGDGVGSERMRAPDVRSQTASDASSDDVMT